MNHVAAPATAGPRAAAGRADLLRALGTGGENCLAAVAHLLGYRHQPRHSQAAEPRVAAGFSPGPAAVLPFTSTPAPAAPTPAPVRFAPIAYWRPEAVEYAASGNDPEPLPDGTPLLTHEYLRSPPGVQPPLPLPIVPWPHLWRRLGAGLRTARLRREIDTRTLVDRWARGEAPGQLPRLSGLALGRVVLIVDRSPRLIPFWDDQEQLVDELARRLGAMSLRLLPVPAGSGQGELPALAGDEVVLAVSDLGFFGGVAEQAAWARLGRGLLRAGGRLRALVPCPATRWQRAVAESWSAIDWGAPTGAADRGRVTDEELTARCDQLLRLLSPAIRIEPGLLREVRRLLPEADLGSEADVWTDPRVDGSSSVAMTLDPPSARRWRDELAKLGKEQLGRVATALLAWHRALPPELRAEEVTNLLACGISPQQLGEEKMHEACEVFRRSAATLGPGQAESEWGPAVDAWLRRFMSRVSPQAWHHQALRQPLQRAITALRRRNPAVGLPVGVTPEMLAGSGAGRKRWRWTVWQEGATLRVAPLGRTASGSRLVNLDSCEPRLAVADGLGPAVEVDLASQQAVLPSTQATVSVRLVSDLETVSLEPFERPPWAVAAGRDTHGLWASFEVEGVVQRLRWIPPGRFRRGSPQEEQGRYDNEGPCHTVTLPEGFWLADTPCVQALWQVVMGENPSRFRSPARPVEQVSWHDCQVFCTRLEKFVPGLEASLPGEEQWDYACRAGTETSTWVGELDIIGERNAPGLDFIAWYGGNSGVGYDLARGHDSSQWKQKQYNHSRAGTREVALKDPNPWGLYDMLGNVWEWCTGRKGPYGPYSGRIVFDPGGSEGASRVFRGGSWDERARNVRAAVRIWNHPGTSLSVLGFRLARGQGDGAEIAGRQEHCSRRTGAL